MDYYFLVWGDSTSDLREKVQEMMRFGWKPQGGVASHVAVTLGQQRFILVQAMVQFSTSGTEPAISERPGGAGGQSQWVAGGAGGNV